jgi:hypothetical protein
MKTSKYILAAALTAFAFTSQAQIKLPKSLDDAKKIVKGNDGESKGGLSNEEVVKGLKEALQVGSKNSSDQASKEDGYYKDPLLFIPFPEDAQKVKEKAEKWGMDKKVNEFVLTMNRAAEESAKEAVPVFVNAITSMSVKDGFNILKGEDNAATEYLRKTTSAELMEKFAPIVQKAIEKVEVTKHWNPIISKYNKSVKFTGGEEINPDLNEYITERAIMGLFVLLAKEEKNIRKDPLARVSDILQKVFGSLDK